MHHTNADSPSAALPLRGAPFSPPPRFPPGASGGEAGAPAGQRARAPAGRMPHAASSGYEQILAARAAMRRGMERAVVADPRDLAGPPLRRAQPRRRKGLVLCCVMAPPVSALLALALVGPQRSPSARLAEPAAPAAAWTTPQPRFAVSAIAAPVPTVAETDGPVFAVQRSGGAPRGDGPPDPGPEGGEPALVAWSPAAPSPAIDAGPAGPPGRDAPPSVLERRAAAEEEEPAAGFALAAGADTPAAGGEAAGANAAGSGAARQAPAAEAPPAASRFAVPAEVPPLPPWVRPEPPPGSGPAPRQPAVAAPAAAAPAAAAPRAAAAAPAPAAPAVPDGVPPLPPWVRAAPEATRTGESPASARAAEGGGSPTAEARCRAIVVKLQLGEDMSHAERAFLQTSCGARRR